MTFETDIKRYINNNPKSKKLHDEAKKSNARWGYT